MAKKKRTTQVGPREPLKPFKRVLEPHEWQHRLIGFEEYYRNIKDVRLHVGVPSTVWQLFETAKNVSLYGRFAYRLHGVSEMMAFFALEWALKEFYGARNRIQPESVRKTFRDLVIYARDLGHLKSEAFSFQRIAAYYPLPKRIRRRSPGEVVAPQIDYVSQILDSIQHLESRLAHGRPLMDHNESGLTLRTIAEAINQLFTERAPD